MFLDQPFFDFDTVQENICLNQELPNECIHICSECSRRILFHLTFYADKTISHIHVVNCTLHFFLFKNIKIY